jgi:hypothetical protein
MVEEILRFRYEGESERGGKDEDAEGGLALFNR